MRQNPFSSRARYLLLGLGIGSLLLALGLAIFGQNWSEPPSAASDSYSRSAIGHRGFVRLLRELDVPIFVSRYESGSRADSAVLLVAEPRDIEHLWVMLNDADRALLVLPKWSGEPRRLRPGWLEDVELLPKERVEEVLRVVAPSGVVVRPSPQTTWQGELSPAPALADPQLMAPGDLTPLIWSDGGVLLAETYVGDTQVWVLADPDLIANHGIDEGQNAWLAFAIIEGLREGGRTVVVDEATHGFKAKPSLWTALFEFPLALVTAQVLLAVLALLWAGTARFGAPLDEGTGHSPGAGFLIEHTAALLLYGGHGHHSLERYFDQTVRNVAGRLHAPSGLRGAELTAWLERVGAARGVTRRLSELEREVPALRGERRGQPGLVHAADRIHRWREEMLYGSGSRTARR